mmetsp:Transcript_15611/g.51081  ORF Transcript_15611/g.51081 Transcript_15611/m.51081 type:complete len:231 (-) Transcript_15611:475-1167(-)
MEVDHRHAQGRRRNPPRLGDTDPPLRHRGSLRKRKNDAPDLPALPRPPGDEARSSRGGEQQRGPRDVSRRRRRRFENWRESAGPLDSAVPLPPRRLPPRPAAPGLGPRPLGRPPADEAHQRGPRRPRERRRPAHRRLFVGRTSAGDPDRRGGPPPERRLPRRPGPLVVGGRRIIVFLANDDFLGLRAAAGAFHERVAGESSSSSSSPGTPATTGTPGLTSSCVPSSRVVP